MKIVFFGDSITSTFRDETTKDDLGTGFVKFTSERLRLLYPEKDIVCLNCGVCGDRSKELLNRVEKDVLSENPDIVVLLAGANDVWRRFDSGIITTAEEYASNMENIIQKIKAQGAKLIVMEPFVFPIGDKVRFRSYLNEMIALLKELVAKEKVPFIPMDEIFRGITKDIKPTEFSEDGVHPTHRGQRYLADFVVKELKKMLD